MLNYCCFLPPSSKAVRVICGIWYSAFFVYLSASITSDELLPNLPILSLGRWTVFGGFTIRNLLTTRQIWKCYSRSLVSSEEISLSLSLSSRSTNGLEELGSFSFLLSCFVSTILGVSSSLSSSCIEFSLAVSIQSPFLVLADLVLASAGLSLFNPGNNSPFLPGLLNPDVHASKFLLLFVFLNWATVFICRPPGSPPLLVVAISSY